MSTQPSRISNQSFDEAKRGFIDVTPLSMGVGIYGLALGLLTAQLAMDWQVTGLMSALVFAGSSQIVAIERLIAGSGAFIAIIAGLALNLRLVLMTASLRGEFSKRPWWQILLGVHLTSDENWVLLHATRNKGQQAGYWYLVGAGASIWLVWVLSTAGGAAFAHRLPDLSSMGIDFAFTAAFILLLTNLWQGKQQLPAWMISCLIAGAFTVWLPFDPSWGLISGALAGAFYAGVRSNERSDE